MIFVYTLLWLVERGIRLASFSKPPQNVSCSLMLGKRRSKECDWILTWNLPQQNAESGISGPRKWLDTFKMSCKNLPSAFPPFILLRPELSRLLTSPNLSVIFLAPLWPQKEWFADHLSILMDITLKLPLLQNLLVQPHLWKFHRGLESLRLHAWKLSSDSSKKAGFSKEVVDAASSDLWRFMVSLPGKVVQNPLLVLW